MKSKPFKLEEKIKFINDKFNELNSDTINLQIIKSIEEIFNYLKLNTKDKMYSYFLQELKNNVLMDINRRTQGLLSKKYKNKVVDDFIANENLFKNKYLLGKLDKRILKKILNICNQKILFLKKNAESKKLERKDLTISRGILTMRLIRLLNKQFKKDGYLKIISNYLQQESEINAIGLELSSEYSTWWKHKDTERQEPKSLYMHTDQEAKNVKAVIYLSDVTEENGPFTVYPGIYENLKINILQCIIGYIVQDIIHTKNDLLKNYYNFNSNQIFQNRKFKEHFNKLPDNLKFNSHFGWDILSGSEEERQAILAEKKIVGAAGTFVIFDGSKLFHRGGLVEKDQRIVLQIVFNKKIGFKQFVFRKFKNIFNF